MKLRSDQRSRSARIRGCDPLGSGVESRSDQTFRSVRDTMSDSHESCKMFYASFPHGKLDGGGRRADGINLDLTDVTWFTVRSEF